MNYLINLVSVYSLYSQNHECLPKHLLDLFSPGLETVCVQIGLWIKYCCLFCIAKIYQHPWNGQLVRRRCTIENQFDLYRRTSWHLKTNTRRTGLLSLMWVYIFISILAVNRRMSYALAMNLDNRDTSITWKKKKKRISSNITFGV